MQNLQQTVRDLLGPWRPHKALGHDKVRVGGAHDGGYVMLDDFAAVRSAIACGVGNNIDFEFVLAEKGIEVDLFDHTVPGAPRPHKRFWFHHRQVSGTPSSEGAAIDFDGIAGHFALRDGAALLKVDIEGDEWELFQRASRAALRPYRQIVCEFHDLHGIADTDFRATAQAAINNLAREFAVVHVHGNNHSPMLSFEGLLVPKVIEITFASRRHYRLRPSDEEFPTPLDTPNHPGKPDFWLGNFDFNARSTSSMWQRFRRNRRDA